MFKRWKLLSQNFLRDKGLVKKLVASSSIGKNDLAVEIGPGNGIITEQLIKAAARVIAVELDSSWYKYLQVKFSNQENLNLYSENFLTFKLPAGTYKVFANIPFNITAGIIKKLTQDKNPPLDAYLVIQKEAALKFAGKPFSNKESLASLLIKPWFELDIAREFQRSDFYPFPATNSVFLRIKKRGIPAIDVAQKEKYEDFIIYAFSQWRPTLKDNLKRIFTKTQFARLARELSFQQNATPTDLDFEKWLGLFDFFARFVSHDKQGLINGSSNTLQRQQKGLKKIHRTRTDKNWRRFR